MLIYKGACHKSDNQAVLHADFIINGLGKPSSFIMVERM